MHYRVLLAAMRKQPFEPFNIVMSNGLKHLVDHPENMSIAKDSVVIPIYHPQPRGDIADDFVFASYLHIAALEPVDMPPSKGRQPKSSK